MADSEKKYRQTSQDSAVEDLSHLLSDRILLESLLVNAGDMIYFKDRQSRFLRVSHAFADRFGGGDPTKLIGLTDRDIFKPEHAEQAARDEEEILCTGQPLIGKIEKETWADGRVTWASTTKLPLKTPEGQIIGTFGISRDITKQQIAQQNLERVAAELRIQNQVYEGDLELASELFSVFAGHLPPRIPEDPASPAGYRCASYYQPAASKLGGDFFIVLPADDHVRLMVCDVMGHGVQSALVAVLMRTWAQQLSKEQQTPAGWLSRLNRRLLRLFQNSGTCFTATAFACDMDYKSGRITFCCAGHPPPLVRDSSGYNITSLETDSSQGPGMGLFEEARYPESTSILKDGETLVIYTDGLIEAKDSSGHEYESIGAERSLLASKGKSPADTLDQMTRDLQEHLQDQPQDDDVCILVIERYQ